ncbi:MAG TPA: hypothetical protein VIQ30_05460 [Pseudonocardia sp.]
MTERRLCYMRGQLDASAMTDDEPLRFVASSTGVNRYGFSLRHEGWRLDNHALNPVFLWMHDTSIPAIGTAPARRENGDLVCYATFDRDDPFAASVERKYRRGFMAAVSVGWDFVDAAGMPIDDWWRMSHERARDEVFYDLTEISAVPVPGDPRALREQRRGLSLLGRHMVELLDEQEFGTAHADEIRAAVRDELAALGLDLAALPGRRPDPAPDPVAQPETPAPSPAAGIEREAADAVLAAFELEKE